MTRGFVLAAVLLLVPATPWISRTGPLAPSSAWALDEPERLWLVGSRAFDDGLFSLAGRMLERLIDRFPDNARVPDATLLLGKVKLSQQAYQPALDAFRRAQSFPTPPGRPGEAQLWEAEALFRLKRYGDARALFEKVANDYPSSEVGGDALYGLAWTNLEMKQRDLAVADFRRFMFSYPDHPTAPSATLYLARTLIEVKRPDEAIPLLRPFAQKYPSHRLVPESRYLLGQALLASGDTKDGLSELREFARAYPSHELAGPARRLAADAVQKKGTKAEQAEEYKQLIAQSPPSAEALYDAGVIATRLSRPRDAETAWTRLMKEFPNSALSSRAALEMAQGAFAKNAFKDASALAQTASKSSEAAVRTEALVLLGESELRQKRYPTAYQAFQQVVETPGPDPALKFRSLAGIGLVMEEQRQWTQAARYYDEVAGKSPDKTLRAWAQERRAAIAPKLKSTAEPKAAPKSAAPPSGKSGGSGRSSAPSSSERGGS